MPYTKSNKKIQEAAFKLKSGNKPSPKKFFGALSFLGNRGSGRGTGSGRSNIIAPMLPTGSSISAGTTAPSDGPSSTFGGRLGSLAAGSQRSRSTTRPRSRGRGFFGGGLFG